MLSPQLDKIRPLGVSYFTLQHLLEKLLFNFYFYLLFTYSHSGKKCLDLFIPLKFVNSLMSYTIYIIKQPNYTRSVKCSYSVAERKRISVCCVLWSMGSFGLLDVAIVRVYCFRHVSYGAVFAPCVVTV